MFVTQIINNFKDLCLNNMGALKGFLQLSGVRGTQIVLGLISTYFLAHSLSVDQYGEYQFALNVLGILSLFSLTEFSNTVMQSVARGYRGSFRKILPYTFFSSIGGSLILTLFSLWYGLKEENLLLMASFITAALFFPFMYGLTIWRGFKIGEENFLSYTRLEIIGIVLTNALTLLSVYFFRGNYFAPFVGFIAIPALMNIFIILKILKRVPVGSAFEEGIIPHGVRSSLYASFPTASTYADKILLFFFLSPSAVALYVAADRMAELLRSAVQDAATALAPRFAKTTHYSDRLDKIFKLSSVVFGLALMVFAFTFLPFLIEAIYGEEYGKAVPYAQALVFSVAIGNLASLQFRYIRSKLDTNNFRNIMVVTSIFRILLSVILIPAMGISGAVLSSVLYRAVLSFTTNLVIRKDYRKITVDVSE